MKRRAALIVALLMALAGCATPTQTHFYTLSDASTALARASRESYGYRVAIGPATVPEAVDRLQIVLRVSPHRYAISDALLWSEALKREIPRVIANTVAQRLPVAHVAAYQQQGGQNADYRVPIDIIRFESVPGASITLIAEWSVQNRSSETLRQARSVFTEPVDSEGIVPLIAAHRKALAALGSEIAAAVSALAQTPR